MRHRFVTALPLLFTAVVGACIDTEPGDVARRQQPLETANPLMGALDALRGASEGPVAIDLDRGAVRFMRGAIPVRGESPSEQAADFLAHHGRAYGLGHPDLGLALSRLRTGRVAQASYRQSYKGVPVYGAELGVYLGSRSVRGTVGKLMSPNLGDLSVEPKITGADAEDLARKALGLERADRVGRPTLRVVDPALLGQAQAKGLGSAPRLAWHLGLGSQGGQRALVDAHSGEILFHYATDQEAYQMEIEDAGYTVETTTWCYYEMFEGSNAATQNGVNAPYTNDMPIVNMWNVSADTYDAFLDEYGLDSFDDDGAFIQIFAHSTTQGTATWTGPCNFFQITDAGVGYDVFLHEFTHALIDRTSKLVYANESGAINESYADVMAAALDDPDPGWFTIGEDAPVGVLRDMSTAKGQPDRYSKYDATILTDNGGVHTNSGIGNKAHFLMAAGGAFNGVTVNAIGREKMGLVAFITLQTLPANADYMDARNASLLVADMLVDPPFNLAPELTPAEACEVQNGWAAVELGQADADCDGWDDDEDADDDNDFVPDVQDNCDEVQNPAQKDNDWDGAGDACDPDDDNDGVLDVDDNCVKPNPDQKDVDNDGLGDACEDFDSDGDLDAKDNCPGDYNPDQKDSDGDGEGDACEPADSDGDGAADPEDLCPFQSDEQQLDSDKDGLGDACDACPNDADASVAWSPGIPGTIPPHPVVPDADGDGVPDACDGAPYGMIKVDGYVVDSARSQSLELSGERGGAALVPIDPCLLVDCTVGAVRYGFESADGLADAFVIDDDGHMVARSHGEKSELAFVPEAGRRYQLGFYRESGASDTSRVTWWVAGE